MQRLMSRRPRREHGGLDAAAGPRNLLIRDTAEPLLEFLDPIAAVDQVRVAIDQSRGDPQSLASWTGAPCARPRA
jgi:hypothetical protein